MNTKRILLAVSILIAIPLVVAQFTRKGFRVEREITINRPRQEVFDYIKYLRNQENYSHWAKLDPKMKRDFRGTDGTVGFVSVWESDNKDVGKGEQEIKKITEGELIHSEIRLTRPSKSTSLAYMTTETVGDNHTKVTWEYRGRLKYPKNLMISFTREKIGEHLATSLANLKTVLEKQ